MVRDATVVLPPLHESELPLEHPLHRPRHSSRQRTALTCALIFFWVPLLVFVLGVRAGELENRPLAAFPSVRDGWGLFTELPVWASDHLSFRGGAIRAADGISRGVFGEPPSFAQSWQPTSGPAPQSGLSGPIGSPQRADSKPSPAGFATVIEGSKGWLYLGFDIRGKCQPQQSLDGVFGQLTRLRRAVESSGRRLVLVVAPDKSTQVPRYLPSRYAGRECSAARREEFWRRAVTEAGVVDLREPLRRQAELVGQQVYFPQDTHWTFDGGLVLTRSVTESYRPGVTATWRVTPGPMWHGEADLPTLLGQHGENAAQQLVLAPDGVEDRMPERTSDFRSPLHLTSAPTTGTISIKTTMLADSYTQFATPCLAAAFNDLTILHLDSVQSSPDAAAQLLVDSELVIMEVVERHLATGASPLTNPATVDRLVEAMAANPRR